MGFKILSKLMEEAPEDARFPGLMVLYNFAEIHLYSTPFLIGTAPHEDASPWAIAFYTPDNYLCYGTLQFLAALASNEELARQFVDMDVSELFGLLPEDIVVVRKTLTRYFIKYALEEFDR